MTIAKTAELRVGRVLERLARVAAYAGGLVLVGMALITVTSIIGRALLSWGLRPIQGDFELVEMGAAIAVFAFLPWCQLQRGHVSVSLVVNRFGGRLRALFEMLGDVAVSIVAGLIMWRLYLGFAEKFPYGGPALRDALSMGSKPFFPETSFELQLPVWIPYGLALIGAVLFFVVSLYTVWRALNQMLERAHQA
ncbi:MAG: TRAP transporter small permease [Pseudomonadota bacterium]